MKKLDWFYFQRSAPGMCCSQKALTFLFKYNLLLSDFFLF